MQIFTNRFPANKTLVMGILNVTPDSFSDGGQYVASIVRTHDVSTTVKFLAVLDVIKNDA